MARSSLIRLRPEEQLELVTTTSLMPRGREHSEQSKSVSLMSVTAEASLIVGPSERECPERLQAIAFGGSGLRGCATHRSNLGRISRSSKKSMGHTGRFRTAGLLGSLDRYPRSD